MNIGTVSKRSGVSAKTIRYYESIGLIEEPPRADNGYRSYGPADLDTLRFIQRARALGFSVKDVRNLLELWRNKERASGDVKALARKHVAEIESRIRQLEAMRRTLLDLMERCHGDDRPDCPILDDLATGRAAASKCH
jgi:Cu(I)-responsive transcriptional regulator